MTGDAEARNRANAYLAEALEYLASAQDGLAAGRPTAAACDANHSGISAKDALATRLTGTTAKNKNQGRTCASYGPHWDSARRLPEPPRPSPNSLL
jgi:hypothetical protein